MAETSMFCQSKSNRAPFKFWNSAFSFNKKKSILNVKNNELHRILYTYHIGIRLLESLRFLKNPKIKHVMNYQIFWDYILVALERDSHPFCGSGCPTSFKESYSILHHKIWFMAISFAFSGPIISGSVMTSRSLMTHVYHLIVCVLLEFFPWPDLLSSQKCILGKIV